MEEQSQVDGSESSVSVATDADVALDVRWSEVESIGVARVGAMYCFKSCDVNNN